MDKAPVDLWSSSDFGMINLHDVMLKLNDGISENVSSRKLLR